MIPFNALRVHRQTLHNVVQFVMEGGNANVYLTFSLLPPKDLKGDLLATKIPSHFLEPHLSELGRSFLIPFWWASNGNRRLFQVTQLAR